MHYWLACETEAGEEEVCGARKIGDLPGDDDDCDESEPYGVADGATTGDALHNETHNGADGDRDTSDLRKRHAHISIGIRCRPAIEDNAERHGDENNAGHQDARCRETTQTRSWCGSGLCLGHAARV